MGAAQEPASNYEGPCLYHPAPILSQGPVHSNDQRQFEARQTSVHA